MGSIPVGGRGPELVGTIGLFVALSTITVLLRCYCRIILIKNFGLDDFYCVTAWALFCMYSAFATLGAHHGTGQHAWDIPQDVLPVGLKWWWSCELAYILSMMALKASICIFLLRIAVVPMHKYIIWSVLVVHSVFSVYFGFIFLFQCIPSAYFWTQYTGGKGSCMDPKIIVDSFYGYSAISCAGDWTLGILPIFIVVKLQMNARTKLSVACILAVGAIASTATIVRIPYIAGMSNIADFLWATSDVAIWSTIEIGIGITASATATLRPLFRIMLGSTQNASGHKSSSQMWGTPAGRPSGYRRGVEDGFVLRSDIGKGGLSTTIQGGNRDDDSLEEPSESRGHDSVEKLRGDGSSDEWNVGIIKTTMTTQVRE